MIITITDNNKSELESVMVDKVHMINTDEAKIYVIFKDGKGEIYKYGNRWFDAQFDAYKIEMMSGKNGVVDLLKF